MGSRHLTLTAGLVLVLTVAPADGVTAQGRQPVVAQPLMTFEQKIAAILMLEDRRILEDARPFPPPPPPAPASGRNAKKSRPALPPPAASLLRLLSDPEGRVRRRAALAVGRAGVPEGVAALQPLLRQDAEFEVRQMAAFAMGLIASPVAVDALRTALGSDVHPVVRGRAAEALAAIGDQPSATAIGAMLMDYRQHPKVLAVTPGDETYPLDPEVEAFRLGVYALTRLKAWDTLAAAVLKADGTPTVRWWPVAFALSRMEDARAIPGLLAIAQATDSGVGRGLAARGLGARKAADAVPVLSQFVQNWEQDPRTAVQAVRALGQIGTAGAAPPVRALARLKAADPNLRLEAVTALGALRDAASLNLVLDLLADPWPAMRVAALRGAHAIDPDNFFTVLSSLETDAHPSVRSALATLLGTADAERAVPRLLTMTGDADARVLPAVITALAAHKSPELGPRLVTWLGHEDVFVRAAAAAALGQLKTPGADGALAKAYRDWAADGSYSARAAALGALRLLGTEAAMPVLKEALTDRDWAVRVKAAALIRELDPAAAVASAMRPGVARADADYLRVELVNPPVSPHVYFETDKGTVEIELAVLDAPQAAENMLKLARTGYFTGVAIHRVVPDFVVQDGDNRGDGEGGPGYSLRDEINQLPYLRGAVGMALDWADTGGSQWFITHSPQPHLDGRYTVFGRVVAGMDVVDRLQQWDIIRRVRTWDGVVMTTR